MAGESGSRRAPMLGAKPRHSSGTNQTGAENRHGVAINPGRFKGRSYVREVLCRLRSYVGRSCVVGGLMSGGFML